MFEEYEQYIETLKIEHKSSHTIRSYSRSLIDFFEHNKIYSIDALKALKISNYNLYQIELLKKGYVGDTVGLKMTHIKSFLNYLFSFGHLDTLPDFRRLRAIPKDKKKDPIALTEQEFEMVLNAPIRLQYRIHVRLMLYLGLRNEETTKVRVKHIVREPDGKCFLNIVDGKGGKDARMPVGDELCEMIAEYLSTKEDVQPEQYLISPSGAPRLGDSPIETSAVWLRVRKILLDSGITEERIVEQKYSPHTFRKTYVSGLASDKSCSAHQLKGLARHSDIRVTERYISLAEEASNEILLSFQESKSSPQK